MRRCKAALIAGRAGLTPLGVAAAKRPRAFAISPHRQNFGVHSDSPIKRVFVAEEIGSEPMARPTTHVIKRFPDHELAIERLARTNESFGAMCEDYAVGVEALRRWERATDPKRAVRIAELRDSLAELEVEILEVLTQKAGRPR